MQMVFINFMSFKVLLETIFFEKICRYFIFKYKSAKKIESTVEFFSTSDLLNQSL